ncbi:type II secretion system F family protein [Aminithiophilus ramosus]|uniref:Type II secretion system F family protein n=2 Tax=Synergistales TaxID=649776 RepID=A0A9Q7EZM4_9BACT|nr:type II secretion system F family protein [Aminithiophilus ramosus]QTX33131.1 type II secretion system F family protein [Aminithiophilus ramosus]QVL37107.1 type II secretion system F family protein [Synergistota bacterium]
MTTFRYSAYDGEGRLKRGRLDGASSEAALRELALQGLVVVEIAAEERRKRALGRPLSLASHVLFCKSLSAYLKSGLPVTEALEMLRRQTPDRRLGEAYGALLEGVQGGRRLGTAMRDQAVFREGLIGMVESGESSGSLVEILVKGAEVYRAEQQLRRKVQSALVYPAVMVVVGLGVIAFLLTYVVPRLTALFSDIGQALPVPTRILLALSAGAQALWIPLLLGTLVLLLLVQRGRVKVKLPFMRGLRERIALSLVFSHLSTLVSSGIPLVQAIQMTAPMDGDRERWKDVAQGVREGYRFAQSLERQGSFPEDVVYVVRIGEMGSELPEALERVAENSWETAESQMERLASLVEPLLILFLGGAVGFVVVAILLPIFDLSGLVK